MSDLFDFDTQAANPLLDEARANSVESFDDLDAPAFRGTFSGIGQGAMRGGARVGQFLGVAAAGLAQGLNADPEYTLATGKTPAPIPEEVMDSYFRGLDDHVNDAVDFWTPAPQDVGKVGQVLGGLSEIVLPLAATGGNPTLLIGSQETGRALDLSRQGATTGGALGAGLVTGAATAAGLKVPILGKTLGSRLATGAAGNVVLGAASRGAEATLLSETPTLAPNVIDPTSLATDTLTGLLFGGLHHTLAPRINPKLSPSEVDAVLAARNVKNFAKNTAPGTPDGVATEVAHQNALETALDQLSRSEPVDVGRVVAEQPVSFADAAQVLDSARLAREVESVQPKDVPYATEETIPGARTPPVEPRETEAASIVQAPSEGEVPSARPSEPIVEAKPAGQLETAQVSELPLAQALKAEPEQASQVPEVAALQQLAREKPEAAVYAGHDETGAPVRAQLADVADQIQEEFTRDTQAAKAYEAAVQCFLGRGA